MKPAPVTSPTGPDLRARPALRELPNIGHGECLVGEEERSLVLQVLDRNELFRYYSSNKEARPQMAATLEREMAAKLGRKFVLGVTSGTAALEVALGALGVGPGDEVIVPVWSWISCCTAIIRCGAKPVFANIDDSLNLDPGEIGRLANSRTRAVVVVHFQGVSADMDPILAHARAANIAVVEDCASGMGASYHGRPVGSMGTIATFSLQNNKVITSGEGGMVATDDPRLYERAVRMHDIGQYRGHHEQITPARETGFAGGNYRLSELTAAVALAQLRKLDRIVATTRRLHARLRGRIGDLPGIKFRRAPDPDGELGIEMLMFLATASHADRLRAELEAYHLPTRQRTGAYAQTARDYIRHRLAHHGTIPGLAASATWPAPGYRNEDFAEVSAMMRRTVTIPIGVLFDDDDIEHIASVLRYAWGRAHTAAS